VGPSEHKSTCQTLTEWGRCKQLAQDEGWCSYHLVASRVEGFRHDRTYHRKIAEGLLESSHDVLSEVEVDALFKGRCRNDGRRTDLYTIL